MTETNQLNEVVALAIENLKDSIEANRADMAECQGRIMEMEAANETMQSVIDTLENGLSA